MVLADTSIWIEHFRHGEADLARLLVEGTVLMHPFIVGELTCVNLKDRAKIFGDLGTFASVRVADSIEVATLIHERKLWGRGLGWIDAHLLASAMLSECTFWTADKKLRRVAAELKLV